MIGLGTKLKKMRETRNFSQEYVSEQIGMDLNILVMMEKNEAPINDELLEQFAKVLNTSVETIKNIDEPIVFNITQGDNSHAGFNLSINNHQISVDLKQLYEDKIELLNNKIEYLQQLLSSKQA